MRFQFYNKWSFGLSLSAVIVLVALVVAFLRQPTKQPDGKFPSALLPSVNQDIEDFFKVYWQRPISLQGDPPSSFTTQESSLSPESCGSCHSWQYADWRESLHSKAMGPGPWGQIVDLTENSPAEAVLCMTCHAPLSEQLPRLAKASDGAGQEFVKNDQYNRQLQLQGITCAACHVRQYWRFGPPEDKTGAETKYPPGMPNHGGVERTPYFERAEFCKDCHQFDPENTLLVNGKPLQDTYREWKSSQWGALGVSCQGCHMPERRHLWRGIHDREWVSKGVQVDTRVIEQRSGPGSKLAVEVDVVNGGVGHKFPTYLTPKIFVRAALLDEKNKLLAGTEQEGIIGWDARFEEGEWKEHFDTRIGPGEKYQKSFEWPRSANAKKVRVWVEVHPDYFYHVHFYPAYLQSNSLSQEGRKLIEEALQESGRTSYILFEKLISVL